MIHSLSLTNFQSHKDATLTFASGVNVIIGPSDVGKSSLFRALNWILTNRPLGDDLRSEWAKSMEAGIELKEGAIIRRVKTRTKSSYFVDDMELSAFGQNPPEDVLQLLKLDSTNIQFQNEPPFLLACTPGEAAQMLNKAASIDDIDHAISGLRKGLAKAQGDVGQGEAQLLALREEVSEYDNLPELDGMVQELEHTAGLLSRMKKRYTTLQQYIEQLADLEEVLENKERVDEAWVVILALEKGARKLLEKVDRWKHLNRTIQTLTQAKAEVARLEELVTKLEAKYEREMPDICPLCGSAWAEGV